MEEQLERSSMERKEGWRSNVDEEGRWRVMVDAEERGRRGDRAVGGED